MSEEEISETLNRVVPHRELPEGMLAGARRRRRRTRALTGGAAVALVAALAVPLGLTMGGSAQQLANPAPTTSTTSPSSQESDGDLCPPGDTTPGAALGDMTRGYACGPVGFPGQDSNESVQIPLSDDLIADIVQAALTTQRPLEEPLSQPDVLPPPFPDNVPGLVLLGPDGTSVTMNGTPDGYNWYAPEHKEFTPSYDLADRIWKEIGRDSHCTVPGYLYPPDVVVDVYDAGGGTVSVQEVTQHLTQAGFAVTNKGKSGWVSPGGPIGVRGANENWSGITLVSSYLDALGVGEMSRDDDVVDLLVTSEFNDVADPFAPDPLMRVVGGSLTCTSPSESAEPSTSTQPATVQPTIRPSSVTSVPPVSEGCWLAAAQKATCGKLISISGDSGDGRVQGLPNILELSSSQFSTAGGYVVLVMQLQPCTITNTPVAVSGSAWTPDVSQRIMAAIGCAEDAQHEDGAWIAKMFDGPFQVTIVSDDRVRVSGEAAFVDLEWE